MDEGWNRFAGAGLALMGRDGELIRTSVLDTPMVARARVAARARDDVWR